MVVTPHRQVPAVVTLGQREGGDVSTVGAAWQSKLSDDWWL
jgi:hypothetical protein